MGEKVYFVYSGYVTPDDYDASEGPIYTLNKFFTEEQKKESKKIPTYKLGKTLVKNLI